MPDPLCEVEEAGRGAVLFDETEALLDAVPEVEVTLLLLVRTVSEVSARATARFASPYPDSMSDERLEYNTRSAPLPAPERR